MITPWYWPRDSTLIFNASQSPLLSTNCILMNDQISVEPNRAVRQKFTHQWTSSPIDGDDDDDNIEEDFDKFVRLSSLEHFLTEQKHEPIEVIIDHRVD